MLDTPQALFDEHILMYFDHVVAWSPKASLLADIGGGVTPRDPKEEERGRSLEGLVP